MIYNLSILDSNNVTIWEIDIENKNSGSGIIKYSKVPKAYKQIFPLNNIFPEDLQASKRYKLKLVTKLGIYNKEFLYQPGEVYLVDSDKVASN